ncbi:glycosyltransferase family 4 protein [Patescibacteria group bacterium]|nr:glycosyltransferase family 4 protein [Patescibacteria group bacterium]
MIIFISNSPFLGGAEYYLIDLVRELRKSFTVKLVCPKGPMRRESQNLGVGTLGINIGATLGRYKGWNLFNPKNIFRINDLRKLLLTLLETHKSLIIQTQDYKELLLFTKAADGLDVRLVYVQHPNLPGWLRKNLLVSNIVKNAMRKQDRIIVVSDANKKELIDFGLKSEIIERIYNGVDLNLFKPAQSSKKTTLKNKFGLNGKSIIGLNARIAWGKGQEILLKSLPKILKEVPNAHAIFLGGGAKFRVRRLEKIANQYDLNKNVSFLGEWPRERVPDFYAMIDVFVLPSLSEGLPLSILEAMASSIPCIGTKVAGIPEEIKHNKNGFLMNERTKEELAVLCIKLLKNYDLRRKMGGASRIMAAEKFSKERMIKDTLNLMIGLGLESRENKML